MRLLAAYPEQLADFNQWVDDHIEAQSQRLIMEAQSMDQVLGMRYMIGEYEALRNFINAPLQEAAQLKEFENGGAVESVAPESGAGTGTR